MLHDMKILANVIRHEPCLISSSEPRPHASLITTLSLTSVTATTNKTNDTLQSLNLGLSATHLLLGIVYLLCFTFIVQ